MNVYYVYLASILMPYFCCKVRMETAWMTGGSGYLAQQMLGALFLAFRTFPLIGRLLDYSAWIILPELAVYFCGYTLVRFAFRDELNYDESADSRVQQLAFSVLTLLFGVGFYTINTYVRGWESMTPLEIGINALYTSICSIAAMVMEMDLLRRQRTDRENRAMHTLMAVQQEQYKASIQNAELVNEKYHDLKKILSGFQGKLSQGDMDSLYQTIAGYDDHVETGNPMVDLVLTEARSQCRLKNIQFTCLVNGKLLDFLDDFELYALLKNILDNAIEAVSQLPEGRERYISMKTADESGMIILSCENPCGHVTMSGGLPQTNQDTDYHGFGMKSMERTASKYGGTIRCRVNDQRFLLDVIFLPE